MLNKNGWVRLPNGLILQWMEIISPYVTSAHAGSANLGSFYFPRSFEEECYTVTLTTEVFVEGEAQLEHTLFDKEKVDIRLNWFGTYTNPTGMKIFVFAIGK